MHNFTINLNMSNDDEHFTFLPLAHQCFITFSQSLFKLLILFFLIKIILEIFVQYALRLPDAAGEKRAIMPASLLGIEKEAHNVSVKRTFIYYIFPFIEFNHQPCETFPTVTSCKIF